MLRAVLNHILKFRAVVRFGGESAVNLIPQNGNTVLFCKGGTFPKLTFDAFLALTV